MERKIVNKSKTRQQRLYQKDITPVQEYYKNIGSKDIKQSIKIFTKEPGYLDLDKYIF